MKMIKLVLIVLSLLVTFAYAKTIQINPSSPSFFDILDIHTTKDSIDKMMKGNKGIKLLKATPKASSESEGESNNHYNSFCFVGTDGSTVTFTSNYSYSGDKISEYVFERKVKDADKSCTLEKKLDAKLKIPVGLALGISKKEVELMFGKTKASELKINSVGTEQERKLFIYHFEDTLLTKGSPGAPPPPNIDSAKAKLKFFNSLNIGINFDSNNEVDVIYVSFSAEPI